MCAGSVAAGSSTRQANIRATSDKAWTRQRSFTRWSRRNIFAIHKEPNNGVSRPQLKVVCIFAGHRRRADVREHLEKLAQKHCFELVLHEVDLVRGEDQDVLDEVFWSNLISFIKSFRPFCIIATALLHIQPRTTPLQTIPWPWQAGESTTRHCFGHQGLGTL